MPRPKVRTANTFTTAATTAQQVVKKQRNPYILTNAQREESIKQYYNITRNQDILIDHNTAIKLFQEAGLTQKDAESIFTIADANGDGFLDLKEFVNMYHISNIHHSTGAAIPENLNVLFPQQHTTQRRKIAVRTANTAEANIASIKAFLSKNNIDVSFADIFTKAIKKVIEIEMNDNEFMTNANIILSAKLQQLEYFLQQSTYKDRLIRALQDQNIDWITSILMQYDPQVYPADWENETQRLTSSIIEKCEPNSAYICPKCNQEKVFATQRQVRSADEGATSFFRCCNCGYIWQEN